MAGFKDLRIPYTYISIKKQFEIIEFFSKEG